MARNPNRPISPHATIWRIGPAMAASFTNRLTGIALSIAGLSILTWWLVSVARGPTAYAEFVALASSWPGVVILIGITWAFFQHLATGVRHLVQDTGAWFEIGFNKRTAQGTYVLSILGTAAMWAYLFLR